MRVWGSRSQTGDKTVGAGRRDTGSVPSVTPSFQSQEHLALGDAIACESGLPDSLFFLRLPKDLLVVTSLECVLFAVEKMAATLPVASELWNDILRACDE